MSSEKWHGSSTPPAGAVQWGIWSIDEALHVRCASRVKRLLHHQGPDDECARDTLRAPAPSRRHQRMSIEEASVVLRQQFRDLLWRGGLKYVRPIGG